MPELVDERPNPLVYRRRVVETYPLAGWRVVAAAPHGHRLDGNSDTDAAGERDEVGVRPSQLVTPRLDGWRIQGDRFGGRWQLLDLRAVKHRAESEVCARLLAGDSAVRRPAVDVGRARGQRHPDPDRVLAAAHAVAELEPRPEAG